MAPGGSFGAAAAAAPPSASGATLCWSLGGAIEGPAGILLCPCSAGGRPPRVARAWRPAPGRCLSSWPSGDQAPRGRAPGSPPGAAAPDRACGGPRGNTPRPASAPRSAGWSPASSAPLLWLRGLRCRGGPSAGAPWLAEPGTCGPGAGPGSPASIRTRLLRCCPAAGASALQACSARSAALALGVSLLWPLAAACVQQQPAAISERSCFLR